MLLPRWLVQLLTVGLDGAICLWDSQQATCIRSIALRVPLHCCRFHTLNPNFALVGSATGSLEVYNCSAGAKAQAACCCSRREFCFSTCQ